MEVMERAFELEARGAKILHLEIGEPDFPPPPAAVEAARGALAEGETRYTDSRGLRELREAIAADKARRDRRGGRSGARARHERHSPAMLLVFSLLVEPGDEVILGTPHYPCYPNFVRALRRHAGRRALRAGRRLSAATPSACARRSRRARARSWWARPRTRPARCSARDASRRSRSSACRSSRTRSTTASSTTAPSLAATRPPRSSRRGRRLRARRLLEALRDDGLPARLRDRAAPTPRARSRCSRRTSSSRRASSCSTRGSPRSRTASRPCARCASAYARRRERMLAGLRALGFGVAVPPAGAFYVLADARRFGPGLAPPRVPHPRGRARRGDARRRLRRRRRGLPALLLRGLRRDARRGARAPPHACSRREAGVGGAHRVGDGARGLPARRPARDRDPRAARTSGSRAC